MAVFLPLPGNERLAADLAWLGQGECGDLEVRRFPDGESYVRIASDIYGVDVVLVATLARPDEKFLPLVFAAETARRLGARTIRLVAPYLAYMRQDAVFRPGEALTSAHFADLLSAAIDGLVTVDPHLHRHRSLGEIYRCETRVVRSAPLLAAWIRANVERPLILGPDSESEQWAGEIAAAASGPYAIFGKERRGDRDIRLVLPDLSRWSGLQPVLVDDIVSSGTTMLEAASRLRDEGFDSPVCMAVHALLDAGDSDRFSRAALPLVTTDSVPHPSNRLALAPLLAEAIA